MKQEQPISNRERKRRQKMAYATEFKPKRKPRSRPWDVRPSRHKYEPSQGA